MDPEGTGEKRGLTNCRRGTQKKCTDWKEIAGEESASIHFVITQALGKKSEFRGG